MFIVFEGGEGSGKSTQAEILAETLRREGYNVLLTCEPGAPQSERCQKIRHLLLHSPIKFSSKEQFDLFLKDRRYHIKDVVKPALEEGTIVICDRFSASTIVYQCFVGDISWKEKKGVELSARQGIIPDLTFLLDISPKIGLARTKKAGKTLTHFDKKSLKFHKKVNEGFLRIAQKSERFNLGEWIILDAQQKPDNLAVQIMQDVHTLLDSNLRS